MTKLKDKKSVLIKPRNDGEVGIISFSQPSVTASAVQSVYIYYQEKNE